MAPGVSSPLYKLTMLASGTREIFEGVSRIDAIYAEEPVRETLSQSILPAIIFPLRMYLLPMKIRRRLQESKLWQILILLLELEKLLH